MRWWLAVTAGLAAQAAEAEIRLALPVDCRLGESCYIQQYTDRDRGPGATDHACGTLSYDGHKGTDFALPTLADLDRDIAVLAAAPGTVRGVRNDMADALPWTRGDIDGRECGNGVVLDHGDGWETQYCHMRRGSVAVRTGERVARGQRLGVIGLSGETEFPHLHLSVRRDGAVVDPFDADNSCGAPVVSLWEQAPDYRPGGLLAAGWAAAVPDYADVKAGRADAEAPVGRDAPGLVLWGYAYGGRAGDVLRLAFTGPEGVRFAQEAAVEHDQALFYRAGGRRTPAGGWPAGRYTGTVELVRDGAVIDRAETAITLD
ncbi:peptidase, M23/M37 family protein [Oceanicola granulosus HTCC2516]|uniref:Peptidase, M23/M37 family protein n=1 Tax=Oceanicola granulosus (strain ATCC BAA-861 / DSM 15982 / KCTC 12143 / HTCC2516) TaxID=314256 RepID=Q2CB45_OCEGH|nr:M23 family metallopeptidase [Oceanicola granulosus]EAR49885.1 peptidase, M23/M37 family protein [Oceanicola granulosus HTCC2516]